MLIVEKFRGANTLEVTRGVEAAIDEMQPGPARHRVRHHDLPAGDLHRAVDRQPHHGAVHRLPAGRSLILVAFLFEWRTAFISLIAIPLSLVAALLVLDLRGATINTMVLAGLVVAIGVVVDDAIIDVENIVRRLRQARASGQRPLDRADRARRLGRGAQRRSCTPR